LSERTFRELRAVAIIAAISLALRAAFALSTDILPDEALYAWTGTQGVSFCPHPPVLPLVIRLGQVLFGRGMLALRWGPLLWGTGSIVLAYVLARELYGGRAGVWAAGLSAVCPIFLAMDTLATPDAPLEFLWLALMYTSWRALRSDGAGWWLATGAVLAAGLYSKYMMVLAVPAVGAALLSVPEGRAQLRRPGPWAAAVLGMLLFVPVFLLWDSRNEWTTLRYHLVSRQHWTWKTDGVMEYVLGHLLFISPVLCVGALVALGWAWRRRRHGDARRAWVAAFGLVPILFFLPPSIFTERFFTREHWDAVGYAAALVALSGYLTDTSAGERSVRRRLIWAKLGVGLAISISGVALVGGLVPNTAARLGIRSTMYRALGWRELASRVQDVLRQNGGERLFLFGDSWITALSMDFYMGGEQHVYTLPHKRNARYGLVEQLERWGLDWRSMVRDHAGQDGLYVHAYGKPRERNLERLPQAAVRLFAHVERVDDFYVVRGGKRLKHFGLFLCRGLRSDVTEAALERPARPGRSP